VKLLTQNAFTYVPDSAADAEDMLKEAAVSMKESAVEKSRVMWKQYTGLDKPPSTTEDFKLLKLWLEDTAQTNEGNCVAILSGHVFARMPASVVDAKYMLKNAAVSLKAAAAITSRMAWKKYTFLEQQPTNKLHLMQLKQKLKDTMKVNAGKCKAKSGRCLGVSTDGYFTRMPTSVRHAVKMVKAAAEKKAKAVLKSFIGLEAVPKESPHVLEKLAGKLLEKMQVTMKAKSGLCLGVYTDNMFTRMPTSLTEALEMVKAAAEKKPKAVLKSFTGLETVPTSDDALETLAGKMLEKTKMLMKVKSGLCLSAFTKGYFPRMPTSLTEALEMVKTAAEKKPKVALKSLTGLETVPTSPEMLDELAGTLIVKMKVMVEKKAGLCLSAFTNGYFTRMPRSFIEALEMVKAAAEKKAKAVLKSLIGLDTVPTTPKALEKFAATLTQKMKVMVEKKAGLCLGVFTDGMITRMPQTPADAASMFKAAARKKAKELWKEVTGLDSVPRSKRDFRVLLKKLKGTMKAKAEQCLEIVTFGVLTVIPANSTEALNALGNAAKKKGQAMLNELTGLTAMPTAKQFPAAAVKMAKHLKNKAKVCMKEGVKNFVKQNSRMLIQASLVEFKFDIEGYVRVFGVGMGAKLVFTPDMFYFVTEFPLFLGFVGRLECKVRLPFGKLKKLQGEKGAILKALGELQMNYHYSMMVVPWDPIRQGRDKIPNHNGLNGLLPRVFKVLKSKATAILKKARALVAALKKKIGISEEAYERMLAEEDLGQSRAITSNEVNIIGNGAIAFPLFGESLGVSFFGGRRRTAKAKAVATRRRRWSAIKAVSFHKERSNKNIACGGCLTKQDGKVVKKTVEKGADKALEMKNKGLAKAREIAKKGADKALEMKNKGFAKIKSMVYTIKNMKSLIHQLTESMKIETPPAKQLIWLCGGFIKGQVGAKVPLKVDAQIKMLIRGRRSKFRFYMDTSSIDKTANYMAKSLWKIVKNIAKAGISQGDEVCRFPLPAVTSPKVRPKSDIKGALPNPDKIKKASDADEQRLAKGRMKQALTSKTTKSQGMVATKSKKNTFNLYLIGYHIGLGKGPQGSGWKPDQSPYKPLNMSPTEDAVFEAGYYAGYKEKQAQQSTQSGTKS